MNKKEKRQMLIAFINYYISGVVVNKNLLNKTPDESVDEFLKTIDEPKICPECKCETLYEYDDFFACSSIGCNYRENIL